MTLKEYRKKRGITVRELAEELKEVDTRFTKATVSYMENGVVAVPDAVDNWLAAKQIAENEAPLTVAEDIVLRDLVGRSKEDPLTRDDLRHWSGLDDRVARKAIEGLRRRGYWIVNGENGGYYITFDREEMERFLSVYTAKAKSIHRVASAMRAMVPGQMRIGD